MTASRAADVVVVGGGVIGLAVARELARAGARVTLLERDDGTRSSTWAAGGMLAPLGEVPDPGPFQAFSLDSLHRYPGWVAALRHEAGDDAGFEQRGMLVVATGEAPIDALRARHRWQTSAGHDVGWVAAGGVRALEPALAPEWTEGLHLRDHAHVDPRRLRHVLVRAATAAGVDIREGVAAASLSVAGARVSGVHTPTGERLAAPWVVVAAGAWSGGLGGLPRGVPVRPVGGQMVALRAQRPLIRGLVVGPGAYLIPRTIDGRPHVVIGASTDDVGFTIATDDSTVGALRGAAAALIPALSDLPETARWAGLRPATPDGLPMLGSDPAVAGLVYATGHYRNGILLAPATAAVVRGLVSGEGMDPRWAAFDPGRFGGSSA